MTSYLSSITLFISQSIRPFLLLFVMLSCISVNVFAHNVVGGVYAAGANIEGEVGFSNGAMANAGTVVKVFDESGRVLGEVRTDDQGFFVFTATKRITHLFEINMGAGHILNMQLPAEELPDSLGGKSANAGAKQIDTPTTHLATNNTGINIDQLEIAIAKQIKPLRKEISALKEKAGMRDIIGGIGYIFGLLGLVALLRERRLKAKK